MNGLWFVTPAWQRYEMTAICLEQRRRVIEELAHYGLEAHQVVIADDENLDVARSVGADVIEYPNILGAKWNEGMVYAAAQGAEWIVQIGSDSWIDPRYFIPLAIPRYTLTSSAYAAVTPTSIAQLRVSPDYLGHSAGPYVFHRDLLAPSRFRPCEVNSRMTDTSTIQGIQRSGGRIRWQLRDVQPFQYVGFRVPPMMTRYSALTRRWLIAEYEPWSVLGTYYPADLVERARQLMTREAVAA